MTLMMNSTLAVRRDQGLLYCMYCLSWSTCELMAQLVINSYDKCKCTSEVPSVLKTSVRLW